MNKNILLGHGSGGRLSHDLIKEMFIKYFSNDILDEQTDAAVLKINSERLSFTTDSYSEERYNVEVSLFNKRLNLKIPYKLKKGELFDMGLFIIKE